MTAATLAYRAVIKARGASARHKSVRALRREAIRLVGYALLLENQRTKGCKYKAWQIEALRGI